MRRGRLLGVAAMGLSLLGGCGAQGDRPSAGATNATAPVTVVVPQAGETGAPSPAFPITMHRLGGVGQFNDVVVLAQDGTMTVSTRTVSDRECALSKAQVAQLIPALARARLGEPTPDPSGTTATDGSGGGGADTSYDPISLTVVDSHSYPVDLSEPSRAALFSQVSDLVADVALTTPLRTQCSGPAAGSTGAPGSPATGTPSL